MADVPTVNINSTGAQIDVAVSKISALGTAVADVRAVADLAAIKAATAGARTEEVNAALSDRIAAIEAQLGI